MFFSAIYRWVYNSLLPMLTTGKNKDKTDNLFQFWIVFYEYIERSVGSRDSMLPSGNRLYKESVISLLNEFKETRRGHNNRVVADPKELKDLQLKIENLTMRFDEESMYQSTQNILRMLIDPKKESARDFLRAKLTSEEDLAMVANFGQYTLEELMVYVLCILFSTADGNSMVRVASLVEQLEGNTRSQAKIMNKGITPSVGKSNSSPRNRSVLEKRYPIGSYMVEFMEERGLISLSADSSGSVRVQKKGNSYYLPKSLYIVCNFDISLLPLKLNLPMVSPPLPWKSVVGRAKNLSDLTGGYLSSPTSEMYDRYRLLSSSNIHNFFLELKNPEELCNIMNCLQNQPFQVNTKWYDYLERNCNKFVDAGLRAPEFIGNLDIMEVSVILREMYMGNDFIRKNFTYSELLLTLQKDISKSRYERMLLDLASAYEGYSFYLPAFLDFRGRIYRSGVLHFHERDLSRSLIQFDESDKGHENSFIQVLHSLPSYGLTLASGG